MINFRGKCLMFLNHLNTVKPLYNDTPIDGNLLITENINRPRIQGSHISTAR